MYFSQEQNELFDQLYIEYETSLREVTIWLDGTEDSLKDTSELTPEQRNSDEEVEKLTVSSISIEEL